MADTLFQKDISSMPSKISFARLCSFKGTLIILLFAVSSFFASIATSSAQVPAWWASFGVLSANLSEDYSVANQGQAKAIASKARDYMEVSLPGGAGTTINTLVTGWLTPTAQTDNYVVLNSGQLKLIAATFYDRLVALGIAPAYPWTATVADDESYSMVNLGQLKNMFSFDPASKSLTNDSDQDGLPDWWERYYFGDITSVASADVDGDGLTNLDEFTYNLNPNVNDYGRTSSSQIFTYDNASKLTGASSTVTESFTLDAESNLTISQ